LKDMLEELADLVPVHAMSEAIDVLEQDAPGMAHGEALSSALL
jgi:hypothetical protein